MNISERSDSATIELDRIRLSQIMLGTRRNILLLLCNLNHGVEDCGAGYQ